MNLDNTYLYLNVSFSDECTAANIKLGVFMYTKQLGYKGGKLEGEDALYFLKNTTHGKQPDLINYFWLFSPDSQLTDLPYKVLTVEIPPITDVKFRHNKFDKKKNKMIMSMMSIPIVKKLKKLSVSDLQSAANSVTDEMKKATDVEAKMKEITDFLGRLSVQAVETPSESDQKLIEQYYDYITKLNLTK